MELKARQITKEDLELLKKQKQLYNSKEVAKMLGYAIHTVNKWREKGQGPAYFKTGEGPTSRVFYVEEDILEWQYFIRFQAERRKGNPLDEVLKCLDPDNQLEVAAAKIVADAWKKRRVG